MGIFRKSDLQTFIPDSFLFRFEDLQNSYLIDHDAGNPNVIAKFRIDYPLSENGKTPLILWSGNQFNNHIIFNAHSSTMDFLVSQDDMMYNSIYSTDAGFNQEGYVEDLRVNLGLQTITNQKLYLLINGFISNLGVESVRVSKIKWQMLLLFATGARVTRLI